MVGDSSDTALALHIRWEGPSRVQPGFFMVIADDQRTVRGPDVARPAGDVAEQSRIADTQVSRVHHK